MHLAVRCNGIPLKSNSLKKKKKATLKLTTEQQRHKTNEKHFLSPAKFPLGMLFWNLYHLKVHNILR